MEEVCVVVRYHHIYLPSHLPNSPEHDSSTNTSVYSTLPPGSSLIAVVKLKPERVQQLLLVQKKNDG